LYGITFIDDQHIESIASGCIHLECIALNFCSRFKGYALKTLLSRCKKIKSLLLQNTGVESEAMSAIEWNQTNLEELDLASTDLNEHALLTMLNDSPNLTYLSVAHCDAFTDHVCLATVYYLHRSTRFNEPTFPLCVSLLITSLLYYFRHLISFYCCYFTH
jgi:hypothetical protein